MRKTGVTKETTRRLILDSGVVFLDYGKPTQKILGAVRGGNSFTIETEYRDMPFDGVGGIVQGARRIISVNPSLTVNLIEINKDILSIAIPGSEYEMTDAKDSDGTIINGETHYEIKRKLEETLPDFKYYDVSIVAEYAHHKAPAIVTVKNAMANSNLEFAFNDADESTLSITFAGTYDPENLAEEPWSILVPEMDV